MQQFSKSVWGYKNHQIRIFTDVQATRQAILNAFKKACGTARFVWNWGLQTLAIVLQ